MSAYCDLRACNVLEEGCNSVKKVLIDLLLDDSKETVPGMDVRRSLAIQNQEVRLLLSQSIHMRHELVDARAEAD